MLRNSRGLCYLYVGDCQVVGVERVSSGDPPIDNRPKLPKLLPSAVQATAILQNNLNLRGRQRELVRERSFEDARTRFDGENRLLRA